MKIQTWEGERDKLASWQTDTPSYRRYHERERGHKARRDGIERYGDPFRAIICHPPVGGPFCTLGDRREWEHEYDSWWRGRLVDCGPGTGFITRWFQTEAP